MSDEHGPACICYGCGHDEGYAAGLEAGRAAERAAVVAWLRREALLAGRDQGDAAGREMRCALCAIAHGEHTKKEPTDADRT